MFEGLKIAGFYFPACTLCTFTRAVSTLGFPMAIIWGRSLLFVLTPVFYLRKYGTQKPTLIIEASTCIIKNILNLI